MKNETGKATHTPGPWEARWSERGRYWFIDYEMGGEGYTLTPLACGPADAQLLSAAPELLEALRDAEFLLRKAGQLAGPMRDSFNRSAADARAAIAKATGGEQ